MLHLTRTLERKRQALCRFSVAIQKLVLFYSGLCFITIGKTMTVTVLSSPVFGDAHMAIPCVFFMNHKVLPSWQLACNFFQILFTVTRCLGFFSTLLSIFIYHANLIKSLSDLLLLIYPVSFILISL